MKEDFVPAGEKILLIDDDEFIAGSLRNYLMRLGWDVDVAVDPDSAHALTAVGEYAVVVIDPYFTGGVSGDHAALLRAVCSSQKHASLILVTAYGSPELSRIADECGVVATLRKPQSVMALTRVIHTAARLREVEVRKGKTQ
jgi:two-component system, OmpR family, response regulator VicR